MSYVSRKGRRNLELARKLERWRVRNQYSKVKLADALGVTRQRIWSWDSDGIPEADARLVELAMAALADRLVSSRKEELAL